jgi:hypothetical protein
VAIIRDSNETSITLKQSDKLTFVDVNNYQLFKVKGDEVDKEGNKLLVQPVKGIKEIADYMTKFYFNKLFETESIKVGQEEMNIIRLNALTTTREDRGIEPD